MNRRLLLITLIAFSFSFQSVSQEKTASGQSYYVGEDGKLYWKGGKPMYLFVSENPDGSNPKRLESDKTKDHANPMYLDTEGINFIRSNWAVDKDGNYSVPRQEILFEVYKDSKAPETSIVFNGAKKYTKGDQLFYGKNLSIELKANDGLSGINSTLFSEGTGSFQPYAGAISPDADRNYSYKFYSIDNVGNSEEPQAYDFIIDVSDPVTTYSVAGDKSGEVVSPRTIIKLSASDNSANIKTTSYKIDDGSLRNFAETISLKDLSEGDHTLTYFSTDNVDNQEVSKEYKFYLDRTAPEVVASVVGDQYQNRGRVFVSTRTKVKLEATDNKSGVQKLGFKIDGGEEVTYKEPFELPRTAGKHEIIYFATDKVNNDFRSLFDESVSGRQALDIDMTAPEIKYDFSGDTFTSRDTAFITSKTLVGLNASDTESGVKGIGYKINGSKGQDYTEKFALEEEGVYTVDFYGTDQVNNRNSSTFTFVVDNTGPKIETILSMEAVGSITLDDVEGSLKVYSAGVKLYLGATDSVVDTESIYYTINGGTEKLYSKPIVITQKGINSFKVRALDKLGNESESETAQIFIK